MTRLTSLLTGIAREHLGFETLETCNSDSLDFHEVAVWPDCEATRRRAYRYYEEELAIKNGRLRQPTDQLRNVSL